MIDITVLLGLLPEILPQIYEYLKTKGGLLRTKDDFKILAKQPEFQKKFLQDSDSNVIIIAGGDIYLGDKEQVTKKVKDSLLAGLKADERETPEKDVNFYKPDFYQRVQKFSETEIIDKDLQQFHQYIKSLDLLNLFQMSRYVKILFDGGNSSEANQNKSDIGNHYGKTGRKFCNLYLQGYIQFWIEYLTFEYGEGTTEFEKVFDSEIRHFIEHSDTIFFIHQHSDKEKIIVAIVYIIAKEEEYIALHAGGKSNIKTTKQIIAQIRDDAIDAGYDFKIQNVEAKDKTPLMNIYITKSTPE